MGAPVPKVLLVPSGGDAVKSFTILQVTVEVFAADSECTRVVVCAPGEWRSRFAEELSERQDSPGVSAAGHGDA